MCVGKTPLLNGPHEVQLVAPVALQVLEGHAKLSPDSGQYDPAGHTSHLYGFSARTNPESHVQFFIVVDAVMKLVELTGQTEQGIDLTSNTVRFCHVPASHSLHVEAPYSVL